MRHRHGGRQAGGGVHVHQQPGAAGQAARRHRVPAAMKTHGGHLRHRQARGLGQLGRTGLPTSLQCVAHRLYIGILHIGLWGQQMKACTRGPVIRAPARQSQCDRHQPHLHHPEAGHARAQQMHAHPRGLRNEALQRQQTPASPDANRLGLCQRLRAHHV
ncbi:hypothetical protein SDC9_114077 [bioreactor metagenome]|uniref:Uncharacterized protein n=1 Tax=bioreactor metagenome TaxID=1076179 RepID=A0A645BNU5_9ZZZZ